MAPGKRPNTDRWRLEERILLVLLTVVLCCSRNEDEPGPEHEYPANFTFVEVPQPLAGDNPRCLEASLSLPAAGASFKDPCYSTLLTRITEIDGIQGRHEYSRFDPFNCDRTHILLLRDTGDYAVYKTFPLPCNQAGNLVYQTNGIEDPRWDNDDPDSLWGLSGFRIVRDKVTSGERAVIKDFAADAAIAPILAAEPDLYRITMFQEGEASADRRYWAFILQGNRDEYRPRTIFCWDRIQDKVLGVYGVPRAEAEIDWVGMSWNGNWILIGGLAENGGKLQGMTIANRALTRFQRIDFTTAHADVGLDAQGREVLVMQNTRTDFIDLIPLSWDTRPILEAGGRSRRGTFGAGDSYAGTGHVPLLRLFYDGESPSGLNSGVHISCNSAGYCLVSTNIPPNTPERNWLDRGNALIRLDAARPRVFMLSKIYNTTKEYFEETQAAMSRDGSRIVWASNWNQDIGREKMCLLQLDMPSNWKPLTGGE